MKNVNAPTHRISRLSRYNSLLAKAFRHKGKKPFLFKVVFNIKHAKAHV